MLLFLAQVHWFGKNKVFIRSPDTSNFYSEIACTWESNLFSLLGYLPIPKSA